MERIHVYWAFININFCDERSRLEEGVFDAQGGYFSTIQARDSLDRTAWNLNKKLHLAVSLQFLLQPLEITVSSSHRRFLALEHGDVGL